MVGSCANENIKCINNSVETYIAFEHHNLNKGDIVRIEKKIAKHIVFIKEGRVKVLYETRTHEVGPRQMLFVPKVNSLVIETIESTAIILLNFDVPMRFCSQAKQHQITLACRDIKYQFKPLDINDALDKFLHYIKYYIGCDKHCCQMHELKFKELGILLGMHYSKEDLAAFFYPSMGQQLMLRDKVFDNYASVKTVAELATICGYSESRFNDIFIKEFEQSPYQWMLKQKSKVVMEKLLDPKLPIKEIIHELNFSSHSHFTRYCKSQYGTTPTLLRQKLLKDGN